MENHDEQLVFGLLGKSLKHSFSEQYFNDKFNRLHRAYRYQNFEMEQIEQFESLKKRPQIQGLNITNPYKEAIIPYLDGLSEEAQKVGAVNTLVRDGDKFIGHNTDVFGFKQMIKPFLELQHERALILGNGGASKAVAYVLKEIGIQVLVVARNPKNDEYNLEDLNPQIVGHCGVIVQTTPVGTFPNNSAFLPFPFEAINEHHLVVDLIYNPPETAFLTYAKKQGATTLNGLTMLHQQAEKSWQLWSQTI